MKVKIKKLAENAVIPAYSKDGDAGMDLTATTMHDDSFGNVVYGTGLSFEIPKGFVGLLFPRSSNYKVDLILSNCVGVLDSGYRGEVSFKYRKDIRMLSNFWYLKLKQKLGFKLDKIHCWNYGNVHSIGDRIGQLIIMPYPTIEFEEVTELSETERGTGGYGHTGR